MQMPKKGHVFKNSQEFVDYVHEVSVKEILLQMGEVLEDDFWGSKINCVFHEEKTPSMQITDSFFKCYGCSAKGDIFKWFMLRHGLNFIEAINTIAGFLEVEIKDSGLRNFNSKQIELKKEWEGYVESLQVALNKNDEKASYLKKEAQSYFPQKVGYDKQRDYIVLAFTSKTGSVLGFTKRRVDFNGIRKSSPKWVHSSTNDSLISNCNNIYNLDLANKHIQSSKEVLFVEGPRDVAAMQRHGFENTVAVSGTSNFSSRVMDTVGYVERVVFGMDGDEAGKEGAKGNIKIISDLSPRLLLETYIMEFPKDKDPSDLDKDGEELTKYYETKAEAIDWFIDNSTETDSRDFYEKSSELVRPHVRMKLMNKLKLNRAQLEAWLGETKTNTEENIGDYTYQDQLLSTLGKMDENVPGLDISEEEARMILRLRFNIDA